MKPLQTLALTTFTLALTANTAWAYNFGFVRAPDWMDPYILALFVLMVPFWIAVMITKPKHISFKTIYQRRSELSRTSRYYYRIFQALSLPLLAMMLVGMGLARM